LPGRSIPFRNSVHRGGGNDILSGALAIRGAREAPSMRCVSDAHDGELIVAGADLLPEPSPAAQRALAELARMPAHTSLDSFTRRACELSAETLEVERVGVWLFIDGETVLRCANLFERSKGEHSSGAVLQVADFPHYFGTLKQHRTLPAAIATEEPWTAELTQEYLAPLGITSMLDAGVFVDGAMVGVVCHEHVGSPREWTAADEVFAAAVAEALGLRIQAAEAHDLRIAFQRQQKRIAAQAKLAAMEELTAGIAHDFKNLLQTVRIYGRLLSQRRDLPEDARDHAQEIVTATDRGADLARELMEFARPTFAPPTVLDLAAATAEFLPALQGIAGPNHELIYSGSDGVGRVLMEKGQYHRILANLVSNAREAMTDGGSIKIRVVPVRLSGTSKGPGRFVLVEVSDQGAGMDAATLARVFEPYFTTKAKGTGLGLPIVQQFVDRVGGFVRVESELGVGTTVRTYIPSIRAGDVRRWQRAAQAHGELNGKTELNGHGEVNGSGHGADGQ
jgi:two-component system cell cycle sensor histidine kinase/response regulator CckA